MAHSRCERSGTGHRSLGSLLPSLEPPIPLSPDSRFHRFPHPGGGFPSSYGHTGTTHSYTDQEADSTNPHFDVNAYPYQHIIPHQHATAHPSINRHLHTNAPRVHTDRDTCATPCRYPYTNGDVAFQIPSPPPHGAR